MRWSLVMWFQQNRLCVPVPASPPHPPAQGCVCLSPHLRQTMQAVPAPLIDALVACDVVPTKQVVCACPRIPRSTVVCACPPSGPSFSASRPLA